MGYIYKTRVEGLVIWLEIVLKLSGNVLDFFSGKGGICCKKHLNKKIKLLGIIGWS